MEWFHGARRPAEPIVDLLAREVAAIAREPADREEAFDLGIKPVGNTPAEFAETIKKEMPVFAAAVKAAGIAAQ